MGTKKPFNFGDAALVRDTEKAVEDGYEAIEKKEQSGGEGTAKPEAAAPQSVPEVSQPKPQEPTKGVQTYIPMSMYRRLNDLKLSRGETIGNLVIQAIDLWLDVQEGTKKVATTI